MARKAVFIIAQKDFRDEELLEPKKVLEGRGIEVKIASQTKEKAIGKLGTEIKPDLAIAEIDPKDFNALVFIGGPGSQIYFNDPKAFRLIEGFKAAGKILGAICIAPSILANAGALISKTVTSFPSEEENLKDKGAEYTGMQVEVDGKIVTAKDPTAAKEFGDKLAFVIED